jgi:hypothetical protein
VCQCQPGIFTFAKEESTAAYVPVFALHRNPGCTRRIEPGINFGSAMNSCIVLTPITPTKSTQSA